MPSPQDTNPVPDRDPLDPFPTLLSSLRTHINRAPVPTYASIARSPINEARPLPAGTGEGSTSRQVGTTTTNGSGSGVGAGWSSDDVDRQDPLDEIATFPSSSSVFRASPTPPPQVQAQAQAGPSSERSGPATSITAGPAFESAPLRRIPSAAEPVPVAGSSSSAGPGERPRSIAGQSRGIRDDRADNGEGTWNEGMDAATRHLYGRGNDFHDRPPRIRPIGVRNRDQASGPSGRQAGGQPPTRLPAVPGSSRGFQAEDVYNAINDPTISLASIRERIARLRADTGLPPTTQAQADIDRDREREARSNRLTTRARAVLAAGAAALEDLSGDEDEDEGDRAERPTIDRAEWQHLNPTDRAIRIRDEGAFLRRVRERERVANSSNADTPEETQRFLTAVDRTRRITEETAALNRIREIGPPINRSNIAPTTTRPIRPRQLQTGLEERLSREDIMRIGFMDEDSSSDAEQDIPEDTGIWTTVGPDIAATTRRVRPFYAHPNITGDIDIDAWETAFGEDPPPLRRGGNNRRRGNTIRAVEGHLPRAHGATETRDVRPLEVPDIAGLEPTNLGLNENIILVTSRRRERVEEDIQKRANSIKDGKRRKVANDEIKSFTKTLPITPSPFPTYLTHTSFDQSDLHRLPREFESTSGTFLRVSYSTIGRPLVKFIDHPQLTGTDADASNIGTTVPIPVECGIYYYEAECICEGEEGFMSVGFKMGKRSQNRLIGWDKGTFGWHSDDGMCFEQSGSGSGFAAKWSGGDTIGVGIDFTTGRAFFTKNGALIGNRFKNLSSGLRPAIGLRSKGEELCINFTGPFRFDIDSYVGKIKEKFAAAVDTVIVNRVPLLPSDPEPKTEEQMEWDATEPTHRDETADPYITDTAKDLPPTSVLREPVEKASAAFVLDYLRHHGYTTALESTRTEMKRREWLPVESTASSDPETLATTHEIVRNLLDTTAGINLGKIDRLLHESALMNKACILQLIHLIRKDQQVEAGSHGEDEDGSGSEMDQAIRFGKMLWEQSRRRGDKAGWDSISLDLLNEASGYIGVPMTKDHMVLWDKRRVSLAGDIEKSLRSTYCLEPESLLSASIKQIQAINTVLAVRDPSTRFIDVRKQLGLEQ